jgi:hypothetical protein
MRETFGLILLTVILAAVISPQSFGRAAHKIANEIVVGWNEIQP